MYKANPRVNDELRQRLPSPGRTPRSPLSPRSPPRTPQTRSPTRTPQIHARSPQTRTSQTRSPPRSPGSHRTGISPDHTCSPAPPSSPLRPSLSPTFRRSTPAHGPGPGPGPGVMEAEPNPAPHSRLEPSSNQNTALGRVPLVSSNQNTAFLDRDKNISFLLKELDSLRDLNSKLQEQLVQKEKQLQRKEIDEQLRQEQTEQVVWSKTTELVEQLMAAQKEREQAVMSRLLLANEERDQALLTAQRLTQAAANQFSSLDLDSVEDCDLDVMELLSQVCDADSVQQVEQFGPILVQRVRLARQRRSDITAQEMAAVMEERDANAAKVKRLEEEQHRDLGNIRADLLKLQRERDAAVGERRRLEAELQELRANQSCAEAPPTTSPADEVTAEDPASLGDDVTALQQQLVMMSQQKKRVEAELVQSNERIRRLERLVDVLRKKVGTGSVRAIV